MKIGSVGAGLFDAVGQADRQTVMTNLVVSFRILKKALKNVANT
jgi:hypothetical protein